jgi:predicted Rossmann fold nucleotide-binding protein DprA/Smf involved in DNA uptake
MGSMTVYLTDEAHAHISHEAGAAQVTPGQYVAGLVRAAIAHGLAPAPRERGPGRPSSRESRGAPKFQLLLSAGPLSTDEIVDKSGLDPTLVDLALKYLEKMGEVQRDGSRWSLTPRGAHTALLHGGAR